MTDFIICVLDGVKSNQHR